MRNGTWGRLAALALIAAGASAPAKAYLFWTRPDFSGPPVRGDEPGIALPLPGATPAELSANLLWTLRAALNVAALQCQFSTPLMTVDNYNTVLRQHGDELNAAYTTLGGYFRRTGGKGWQRAFDSHTTQSYNGLTTFHAQFGFCETAAEVGREALAAPRHRLAGLAELRMRAIRNSLVPRGDAMFARHALALGPALPFDDKCWKKGKFKAKCAASALI